VSHFDRIWNGWRNAYVVDGSSKPGGVGSLFTQILQSGLPDEETHIVHRGPLTFALLNAFPYTPGHLMILPYREVGNLESLTDDEHRELWLMVTQAVIAVKAAYVPGGVNVGINLGQPAGGSVSEHLHVHVVPRWSGDSNFMTAIAEARTLPEALSTTAMKVRAAWP
jgi:ATP adenylyltransferase